MELIGNSWRDEEGGWAVLGPEKCRIEMVIGFISFQRVSLKIQLTVEKLTH